MAVLLFCTMSDWGNRGPTTGNNSKEVPPNAINRNEKEPCFIFSRNMDK